MSMFALGVVRRVAASKWGACNFSASSIRLAEDISKAAKIKEAPLVDASQALQDPQELQHRNKLSGLISIPVEQNISEISGVPSEHIKTRLVRIFIPAKNAMQSATNNIQTWKIEFDNRERWENPLMGWSSSGDPLSNMNVEFASTEEAIRHCEKNGWKWFIDHADKQKRDRVKNYGANYAWNKRTRVTTK